MYTQGNQRNIGITGQGGEMKSGFYLSVDGSTVVQLRKALSGRFKNLYLIYFSDIDAFAAPQRHVSILFSQWTYLPSRRISS